MKKTRSLLSILILLSLVITSTLPNMGAMIVSAAVNYQDARTAIDGFFNLKQDDSKADLIASLSAIMEDLQDTEQELSTIEETIEILTTGGNSQDYAQYILDWIVTWNNDKNYQDELKHDDPDSEAAVSYDLNWISDQINWLHEKYSFCSTGHNGIQDFVNFCRDALPDVSDDCEDTYAVPVDDNTLYCLNKYVTSVLDVYGGQDFVDDWNGREDNEGFTYPVAYSDDGSGISSEKEFDKETVQEIISYIAELSYSTVDESKLEAGKWTNDDYICSVMNKQAPWSSKENDDVAQYCVESIGWGAKNAQKPYEVIKDLPEDIELEEGEVQHTEIHFASFSEAMEAIDDARADYELKAYFSPVLELSKQMFEEAQYRRLFINLKDEANNQKIQYNESTFDVNGEIKIHAGSFQFTNESGVTLLTNLEQGAYLNIDVKTGSGKVQYNENEIDFWTECDAWDGEITEANQELTKEAVKKLNVLFDEEEYDKDDVLDTTLSVLQDMTKLKSFYEDFSPSGVLSGDEQNDLWTCEDTEQGPVITIQDKEMVPDELAQLLYEEFKSQLTKDEDGNYNYKFKDYLDKYKNDEKITYDDQKNLLHTFLDWTGTNIHRWNSFGNFHTKFEDFLESETEQDFTDSLTSLITDIANDSQNGKGRYFAFAFDESDLWNVTSTGEPDWIDTITIHFDKIPFSQIYELFMAHKDDEWGNNGLNQFDTESFKPINVHDYSYELIHMVLDYTNAIKEAEAFKDDVLGYRDILLGELTNCEDYDSIKFSSEGIEALNGYLKTFEETSIAGDYSKNFDMGDSEETVFPKALTSDNIMEINRGLADIYYSTDDYNAKNRAILSSDGESISDLCDLAKLIIEGMIENNYRWVKHGGMSLANGEITDIRNVVNGILNLSANASYDTVNSAFESFCACMQEGRKDDYSVADIQEYLGSSTIGAEFATYIAQSAVSWRLLDYKMAELSNADTDTYRTVDRDFETVAGWLRDLRYNFDDTKNAEGTIRDFISNCKQILPEGTKDYSVLVDDTLIQNCNQDLEQILGLFGGKDFVDDWNQRAENPGAVYPFAYNDEGNIIDGSGLNQDNIKCYLSSFANLIHTGDSDEAYIPFLWNNPNYQNEILGHNSWTVKELSDIVQLIVEAIGWDAIDNQLPYKVSTNLDDESLPEEERHVEKRFTSLEAALDEVQNSAADYNIEIYQPGTVILNDETFRNINYRYLNIELKDQAQKNGFTCEAAEFPIKGELTLQGGFMEFTASDGVTLVGESSKRGALTLFVESGSGNVTYDQKNLYFDNNNAQWDGSIDNGENAKISQAASQLNALLDYDSPDEDTVADFVISILNKLVETEEYCYDFSPDGAASKEISEALWSYNETEQGAAITIKNQEELPSKLKNALQEIIKSSVTPDEAGYYYGDLGSYVSLLKKDALITEQDRKGVFHNFIRMIGTVILEVKEYDAYKAKFMDVLESNESSFVDVLDALLSKMANESINGRENPFFGNFKDNSRENLWTAEEIDETQETNYQTQVTLNLDGLLTDGVFEQFEYERNQSYPKWEFVKYNAQSDSVKELYDMLDNLLYGIDSFQRVTRETNVLKGAVSGYLDIIQSVYEENTSQSVGYANHEDAAFTQVQIDEMNGYLDIFKGTDIYSEQLTYLKAENKIETGFPEQITSSNVKDFNYVLADYFYCKEYWAKYCYDNLHNEKNLVLEWRNCADVIINSLLDAQLRKEYPYQAESIFDVNQNGVWDEGEKVTIYYTGSWAELLGQLNEESEKNVGVRQNKINVYIYSSGVTEIEALPNCYNSIEISSNYMNEEGTIRYTGENLALKGNGLVVLSPFEFAEKCNISSEKETKFIVDNTVVSGNVTLDQVMVEFKREGAWNGTYKDVNEPVISEIPEVTSEPPAETSEIPVVTTEPPAETLDPPIETTEPPVVTSEPPVVTSEPPVITSEPPVVTTEPPVVTSELPVITSEPPVVTTEPPVVTSKPPVVTSEPPVVTSEPPVVTTVPPVTLPVSTQPYNPGDGGAPIVVESPSPSPSPSVSTVPEQTSTETKTEKNKKITTTTTIQIDKTSGAVIKTVTDIVTNTKTKTSTHSITVVSTLKNGNSSTTIETTYKNKKGNVTKTVSIASTIDVKTGMEIEVKEEKNSKGEVTDADATITPGVVTAVHDKKMDIAFSCSIESIIETAKKIVSSASLNVSISISADKIAKEIKANAVTSIQAFIDLPQPKKDGTKIKVEDITLEKDVLANAKKAGSDIKIAVADPNSDQKAAYEWSFSAKDLKKAKALKDLDLSVNLMKPSEAKKTDAGKVLNQLQKKDKKAYQQLKQNSFICSFGHNGELGCEADVRIGAGNLAKQNTVYYLYHANTKKKRLDAVPFSSKANKDGYLNAKIKHCSDYIFTTKKLPSTIATPLEKQITGIVSDKNMKAGASYTIKPVLPSTINKVKKLTKPEGATVDAVITYKSSDSSIAKVNSTTGKITAKKKGNCTIITSIKLANGSSRTVKTKVAVK